MSSVRFFFDSARREWSRNRRGGNQFSPPPFQVKNKGGTSENEVKSFGKEKTNQLSRDVLL